MSERWMTIGYDSIKKLIRDGSTRGKKTARWKLNKLNSEVAGENPVQFTDSGT